MAFVVKDRVKETTTTTGTSDLVLSGSVSGFQSFSNALADGDTTYYALFEVSTNEWEVGVGTWTESTTTLARTTVLASSNSGSKVSLTAQAEVFISQPAGKAAFFDPSGDLTLVQDPTSNLQAATKQYVDTIAAAGLHYHDPVRVEQEGNLSATYSNGTAGVGATLTNNSTQAALTIDGVALSLNDRVLIYEQTNGYENGIYTVTNVGSASTNWVLTRATDADSYAPSDPDSLGQGDAFFVLEGAAGAGELYVMNTQGTITFGTTNITFTQVASTAVYSAGTGLTLTGTEFAAAQDISTTASPSFAGITVGDGHTIGDDVGDNLTLTSSAGENIIYNSAAGTHAFKSNGTSTVTFDSSGNITVTGNVDGRDIAADGTKLDGIESGATADQTKADIDALGIDAATLDSLDSTQFLRSDANDTATGKITLANGGFADQLEVKRGDGDYYSVIQYSNSSRQLGKLGFTQTGALIARPLSATLDSTVWHSSNDGSGSGLDADTVDGIEASSFLRSDANDTTSGTFTIDSSSQTSFNVEYANDGTGVGPLLRTFRDSASPAANDILGGIDFKGNNSAGTEKFYARIKGVITDPTDTSEDGAVEISVSKAGTAAWETSALVAKFDANGMELRGDIIFEGSTANNSETTLTVTDPTADRTITLPDATGTVWTSGNDGAGSGLDADTVDGIQASSFLRSDADDTYTGTLTLGTAASRINGSDGNPLVQLFNGTDAYFGSNARTNTTLASSSSTGIRARINTTYYTMWHAGNDGSGSGLDADTLDGVEGSNYLRSDEDDTIDGNLTIGGTAHIAMQEGHYVNRRFEVDNADNSTTIYILLCRNAANNDVNGTITMDRTSGLRHACKWDIIVSSGTSTTPVGSLMGHSVAGAGQPDARLVTLTYSSVSYVALEITNPDYYYESTGAYFNGRIVNSGSNTFTCLKPASVSAVSSLYISTGRTIMSNNLEVGNSIYVPNEIIHDGDDDTKITFGANVVSVSAGGSQEVTVTPTGVQLGDTGNGYFQPVSGDYGSIQIDGGAHTGWEGYSIGGRAVFMHNNSTTTGIYNDVDNEWLLNCTHNGETYLYYNGSTRFNTTSSGININGDLNAVDNIYVASNIYHEGDTDTYVGFADNVIYINAGNSTNFTCATAYTNVNKPLYNYAVNYEDFDGLTGTSVTVNCDTAQAFSLIMTGNTTFTFNSVSSPWSTGFVLELTGNGGTVTWPTSVEWAGGTAPDAPASGETDIYVFWTRDGGTTWYGVLSVDAAA